MFGRGTRLSAHGLKYAQSFMAMVADPDFSNTTIRRFDVLRLIARGGMGEVYLARDAVLGRDLALKILRQDVTWDANRLDRFVQEARAASALNHPHLIAIYDIGESAPKRNGVAQGSPVLYIAMELVSGETLRQAIEARRLDVKRALEYLIQVADALGAAHAAGVIHRDLKPENLMIADGGYAKVLDFGVAKLRADMTPPREDSTPSSPGAVIGTVGYMSPEQVRAQPLDPRTDIFSFGCVLYEVITGRRAFQGTTSFDTLKRILSDEPLPIVEPLRYVRLQPVVQKCLAKNPDDRYQSMEQLANELRGLVRRMEAAAHREAAGRVPWRRLLAGGVAIVGVVLALWWGTERGFVGRAPAQVTIERLTLSGTAIDAATSRDGRYLAWVESAGGLQGLRVRARGGDGSVELVPPAAVGYWGIAFSHDGTQVFYATKSAQEPAGRLYVVNVLGGMPRALLDGIDSTISCPRTDGGSRSTGRAFPSAARVRPDRRRCGRRQPARARERARSAVLRARVLRGAVVVSRRRTYCRGHPRRADRRRRTGDRGRGIRTPRVVPQRFQDATFTAWLPDGSGILSSPTRLTRSGSSRARCGCNPTRAGSRTA